MSELLTGKPLFPGKDELAWIDPTSIQAIGSRGGGQCEACERGKLGRQATEFGREILMRLPGHGGQVRRGRGAEPTL